jgi:hypothetical protein
MTSHECVSLLHQLELHLVQLLASSSAVIDCQQHRDWLSAAS